MALTRRGARLYDDLMEECWEEEEGEEQRGEKWVGGVRGDPKAGVQREVPGYEGELMRQGLGYWMFSVVDVEIATAMWHDRKGEDACGWLADMVERGALEAEPITYEDFLPASAAGIFQSNLPQAAQSGQTPAHEAQTAIDEAQARKSWRRQWEEDPGLLCAVQRAAEAEPARGGRGASAWTLRMWWTGRTTVFIGCKLIRAREWTFMQIQVSASVMVSDQR